MLNHIEFVLRFVLAKLGILKAHHWAVIGYVSAIIGLGMLNAYFEKGSQDTDV